MPGLTANQCLLVTDKGRIPLHFFNNTIAARAVTRITGTPFGREHGSCTPPFSSPPKPFQSAERLLKFQILMRKKPHG